MARRVLSGRCYLSKDGRKQGASQVEIWGEALLPRGLGTGPEELQGGQCGGSRGSGKSEGLGAHQIGLPGSFSGLLLLFLVIWGDTEGG